MPAGLALADSPEVEPEVGSKEVPFFGWFLPILAETESFSAVPLRSEQFRKALFSLG